jgi:hypothetical protein
MGFLLTSQREVLRGTNHNVRIVVRWMQWIFFYVVRSSEGSYRSSHSRRRSGRRNSKYFEVSFWERYFAAYSLFMKSSVSLSVDCAFRWYTRGGSIKGKGNFHMYLQRSWRIVHAIKMSQSYNTSHCIIDSTCR